MYTLQTKEKLLKNFLLDYGVSQDPFRMVIYYQIFHRNTSCFHKYVKTLSFFGLTDCKRMISEMKKNKIKGSFFPKDIIILENEGDCKKRTVFCFSFLPQYSVKQHFSGKATGHGTLALSLTGHVTIKETRDKSSLEPVFLATRE